MNINEIKELITFAKQNGIKSIRISSESINIDVVFDEPNRFSESIKKIEEDPEKALYWSADQ